LHKPGRPQPRAGQGGFAPKSSAWRRKGKSGGPPLASCFLLAFWGWAAPAGAPLFLSALFVFAYAQQGAGKLMVVPAGAAVDAGRGAARHLGLGAGVLKG